MTSHVRPFTGALLRIAATVLACGLLSATLVRFSRGVGMDERQLDVRLSAASQQAIRQSHDEEGNPVWFNARYGAQVDRRPGILTVVGPADRGVAKGAGTLDGRPDAVGCGRRLVVGADFGRATRHLATVRAGDRVHHLERPLGVSSGGGCGPAAVPLRSFSAVYDSRDSVSAAVSVSAEPLGADLRHAARPARARERTEPQPDFSDARPRPGARRGCQEAMTTSEQPLLKIRLAIDYAARRRVLDDAEFDVRRGEIVGLVGSSGSGKSSLALALLRLLETKGGRAYGDAWFRGLDLLRAGEREMRGIRGSDISFVPKSPMSFLNPAMRMDAQMNEAWRAHKKGSSAEMDRAAYGAVQQVGLPAERSFLHHYPGEVSVGQGPTSADRDGDSAQPGAVDRRRARQFAGRNLSGRGARAIGPPEPGTRHGESLYFPRPALDRRLLRSGGDTLRRPGGGIWRDRHSLRGAGALVHAGTDRL